MSIIPQHTSSKKYTLSEQQHKQRSKLQTELLFKRSQAANETYDANPNLCQACRKPIPRQIGVRLCQTKRKKYCNSSCAAHINNQAEVAPKRNKERIVKPCKSCGTPLTGIRRKNSLCKSCYNYNLTPMADRPKSECSLAEIRMHARRAMNGTPKVCTHCGYTKHVQVCHIQAIKNFPKTAMIGEINNIANLIYLCPNCHWELDHKLLTLDSNQEPSP